MTVNKDRKFLFDHNNFDLPETVPEPEVYVEPPPLFTLDELGHVRDEAFEKGRLAGLEEARVSREQYLAEQLERVAQELTFLTGAEDYRSAVYEREAVALTGSIFQSLFPHFTEREGVSEIKSVISKVLLNQSEQSLIVIELPAEDAAVIESYFSNSDIDLSKITFKSSPQIARASCRMSWKDGGALRDHQSIADEIAATLRQVYAPVSPRHGGAAEAGPIANRGEKDETEFDSTGE